MRYKRYRIIDGDGDVEIYAHTLQRSIVFKNKGNVIVHSSPVGRKLRFENEGNVVLNYGGARMNSSQFSYKNKGNVDIYGFPRIQNRHSFRNSGYVNIHDKPSIGRAKLKFYNKGHVCIDTDVLNGSPLILNWEGFITSAKVIARDIKFANRKDVKLPMANRISSWVNFCNKGSVYLTAKNVTLESGIIFSNSKNVHIPDLTSLNIAPTFNNYGTVSIGGCISLVSQKAPIFNNTGTVTLRDLEYIKCPSLVFNNKDNVNLPKVTHIESGVLFKNRGSVKLLSVYHIARKVRFENGRNVVIKSAFPLDNVESHINCGGNVFLKNVSVKKIEKVLCGGYIFTDDNALYPGSSYLTRHKINICDGSIILYKNVNKDYIAEYDENDIKLIPGTEIILPDWNPYQNEIGKGKIVAAAKPEWCRLLGNMSTNKIIAVSVNIFDLFEWTCLPKYPQYIGFNKCIVLYECDSEGNKINN